MCLSIYAIKCGVPKSTLQRDAYNYIPFMNSIEPTQPFTKADCDSAMEAYEERYATFPIDDIEKLADIRITKNKRNGRKQADHIKLMNYIRDEINGQKDWHGRKPKRDIVEQWQQAHPNGKKVDCINDLKIDRKTASKYSIKHSIFFHLTMLPFIPNTIL